MKKAVQRLLISTAFCTLVLLNIQSMETNVQEIWKDVVGFEGYYQVRKDKGVDHPKSKQVIQLTILGEVIKKWDCISDVHKELGFNVTNICKVCKGKLTTAYGFKWSYV